MRLQNKGQGLLAPPEAGKEKERVLSRTYRRNQCCQHLGFQTVRQGIYVVLATHFVALVIAAIHRKLIHSSWVKLHMPFPYVSHRLYMPHKTSTLKSYEVQNLKRAHLLGIWKCLYPMWK